MTNDENMPKLYTEDPVETEKLYNEMLNDNPHIVSDAQKALLMCWCRLLLHIKSATVNREWSRFLSELRQLSKLLYLSPDKPKGYKTDLVTLLQETDSDD